MKANENLMVGDWVKFKGSDLYHQVKVVSNKSIKFDNQKWFAKSSVEPIPLTPEILEKNGFEKVYDEYKLPNYRIKWKSYTNLFFTVFTGVDGYWNHVGLGVIIGGVPATLDYVHQLQHALRLCEIEKEIEL